MGSGQDLALSDTMIGVINGFGFLVVYAVVSIVIAWIADRGAFGLVVSMCLTVWGAMTILGGAVQSRFQLVLTRVGVAIGEAGSTTAAHAGGTDRRDRMLRGREQWFMGEVVDVPELATSK